jgi:hypothetical protein
MSGVQFDDLESCSLCARRRCGEIRNRLADVVFGHRYRGMVVRRKCNRRGSDGLPSAVSELDPPVSLPRCGSAGFAASVRQLNAGIAALRSHKTHDTCQGLDMRVGPEAEVVGADTSDWGHSRRLGEDESSAADRAASEMHEVPLVGPSVDAGVFAHRRHGNAVGQCDATQGKRFEQDSQTNVLSSTAGDLLMR